MNNRLNIALLSVLLSGCAPTVTTHGNMLSEAKLAKVQPVTSSRADVQSAWGPPTTASAFNPNVWYYVGETQSQRGIFEAEVEKRQVIRVTFGADDKVAEVATLDPKMAREIDFVSRKTPAAGKEFTAFQQFVGNIGKFNSDTLGKK